jgi:hypothetical protein
MMLHSFSGCDIASPDRMIGTVGYFPFPDPPLPLSEFPFPLPLPFVVTTGAVVSVVSDEPSVPEVPF